MKRKPKINMKASQEFYEQYIKPGLLSSFFQEWGRQIEQSIKANKVDASVFANFVLELMRDPKNDEGRRACAGLANVMRTSSWAEMSEMMAPNLDSKTSSSFKKAGAKEFYEQFREFVLEQVREYWEQFIADREKKKRKKKK